MALKQSRTRIIIQLISFLSTKSQRRFSIQGKGSECKASDRNLFLYHTQTLHQTC
jgi:hypothetical protein